MCGSLENFDYMVKMHVLAPSLTPRGGILVRMVSCGMVGDRGFKSRSRQFSYFLAVYLECFHLPCLVFTCIVHVYAIDL